jgi:hypothetical protein
VPEMQAYVVYDLHSILTLAEYMMCCICLGSIEMTNVGYLPASSD